MRTKKKFHFVEYGNDFSNSQIQVKFAPITSMQLKSLKDTVDVIRNEGCVSVDTCKSLLDDCMSENGASVVKLNEFVLGQNCKNIIVGIIGNPKSFVDENEFEQIDECIVKYFCRNNIRDCDTANSVVVFRGDISFTQHE